MEDRLVTVAIHTYERALILKGILESEGIEVFLHNVNLIQPVVSAGVRVRIKESDLVAALGIIEKVQFSDEPESDSKTSSKEKKILVPVDFSEYSFKAAQFAFDLAKNVQASIVLLHTYYNPFYSGGMPISDAFAFDETSEEALKTLMKTNKKKMLELTERIKQDIQNGEIPDIPFEYKFREGVPEEQILIYAKKHQPFMIIMGTRGKGAKESSLMGSVTAEIIDRSPVPVFAFPENTPFDKFDQITSIGFLTNFEQRDLVAFDSMIQLLKPYTFKVFIIHLSNKANRWNEIQIAGIKEYFSKNYPGLSSSYCVIESDDLIGDLDDFVRIRKIDVLTLTAHKRNLFARLFNPGIAHKMLFHSDTPLLVLRS